MSWLLDTNVVSELRKSSRRGDPAVRAWIGSQHPFELHLSSITVLEIELGIRRIARRDPDQAVRLQRWLDEDLLEVFSGRVLPIDAAVARRAARMHVPDPRPERDALIAATAAVHGFTVVTRNVRDFRELGVPVVDPWEAQADS